jgi:Protein of unknown function (DUF2589)
MAVANELSAIPFGALIGGPMTAAIEAQAKSAMTSVDFIRTVGFDKDGNVINVVFKFKNGPADADMMTLEVPLLTILPIPFLRIETMDINFKASISQSTQTSDKTQSVVESSASLKAGGSYWFVKAEMSASVSAKKDTTSSRDSRYAVEYTMDISVHAVQDDVPGGMAKVLNLLTESVDRKLQARPTAGGGGG